MIDSNPNEFAGAVPVSESAANWTWLQDRLQVSTLENFDLWMDDQLAELELGYEDWSTEKSREISTEERTAGKPPVDFTADHTGAAWLLISKQFDFVNRCGLQHQVLLHPTQRS